MQSSIFEKKRKEKEIHGNVRATYSQYDTMYNVNVINMNGENHVKNLKVPSI